MPPKTIEQQRAKFAFDKICEVIREKSKGDYKSLVRGFSSMILQNGLGQALAFLKAKGKQHHIALYNHINLWLKQKFAPNENDFDILTKIMQEDSIKYRLYTKEALSFLVWLKKFAEAEIPDE